MAYTQTKQLSNTTKVLTQYPGLFKKSSDIEVPDILFNPFKTGTPELDKAFSEMGGVTPSCVTMVTGTPGAGKTTLMCSLGARIQSPRPVVMLNYEMSEFQTKLAGKKIPNFDKMYLVSEPFHKVSREAFVEFLFGPLKELNPSLVIADSIQKMAGVMAGSFNANQIWLVEQFTKFAKETFIPVNLIGHVSKDGTYKGPTTLLHEVDAHMKIWIDKELGERVFAMGKNRFGGVGDPFVFRINSHGVYIGEEWWMKAAEDGIDGIAEMAKSAINEFKGQSRTADAVPFKAFQKMAKTVHKYLETKYHDDMIANTVSGKAQTRLTWKGARAFCKIRTGAINYGEKFFKTINNGNWKGVGYKTEKPFIARHCENKEDVALWVIWHEFQHLYKGCGNHTKSFFSKIEKRFAADMRELGFDLRTA